MRDDDGPRRDRLEQLVSVVRAQTPPDVSLERLRRVLSADFEAARARGELGSSVASSGRLRRSLSWIAVAATLLLGIGVARQWVGVSSDSALIAARNAAIDGRRLEPGVEVVARPDQALRIEHPGRATWELEPGSRAHLLELGSAVLCVELTQGTLTAAVVPGGGPESFIVRARGTEVAVHGTRFRVRLDVDSVHVDVAEGEVEVRPMQRTSHVLLTRGMNAGFVSGVLQPGSFEAPSSALPGAVERDDALREPEAVATGSELAASNTRRPAPGALQGSASPDARSRVAGARAPQSVPLSGRGPSGSVLTDAVTAPAPPVAGSVTPAAPVDSSKPSAALSDAVADAAIGRVTERIEACFRRHTPGRGPLSIEASTRVALEVQPNGSILGVSLNPPLAPQVEHCVANELATINLGESESGYRVLREIQLSL